MRTRSRPSAPGPGFAAELGGRTRRTGLAASIVALIVFPGWSGFDRLLEPEHADVFLRVRLTVCLIIVLAWAPALILRSHGVAAELAVFTTMASCQVAIAWMLPQVQHAFPAYLLGFTVVPNGGALLIDWRPRNLIALVATSLAALGVADLTAPHRLSALDIGTATFYLGTVSAVAVVGQYLRYRISYQELLARHEAEHARAEAERQREQNLTLLAQVERLSREDPLTGIANRRVFDEALARGIVQADRTGGTLGLILLDLDHFKLLNDTHGHQAGDEVLRIVGECLQRGTRAGDTAARYGGEEFAVLVPDVTAAELLTAAESLRHRIGADTRSITASAGAALYPQHAGSADALIGVADTALYAATAAGRDRSTLAGAGLAARGRS